jgi:Type VI secretion system (T6SS), amidase effector protein 4
MGEELLCTAGTASCTIVANRPKWSDVLRGYPRSGTDDLPAEQVFQAILATQDYDPAVFSNACATRVSLGLLEGGMSVRAAFRITNRSHKFAGKGFQSSAAGLQRWLSGPSVFGKADIEIKGPTDIATVRSRIGSKNGIYIILGGFGGGITGHATLWIGSQNDAVGGHNYADYGGDVYFWELID